MDRDHCCKECRRLGETTSLKGISRIIKSKHIVLKVLWIVCTLTFVSLALYQAVVLLRDYFRYPETTDLDEHSLDLVKETSVDLPHITVCNLNPLSERATDRFAHHGPGHMSFQEFILRGTHTVEAMYNNATEKDLLRRQLLKPRGYFGILGREAAELVGHTQEEFLVSCKVLVLQGLDLDEQECSELANISLFQHSKYFNCYTIAMHDQTPENIMVGYSLTLQLANYETKSPWFEMLDSQRKQNMGAMLAVHEPHTYPLMIEEGHIVAPGTHVNLRYSLEQRNRLPEPHGNCETTENFLHKIGNFINVSIPYEYTKSMCESVGLEYHVMRDCNCTDYTLMQILEDDELPGCSDPKQRDAHKMMDQLICAQNIRKTKLQDMMKVCPDPCHQLRYIPEISEAVWPPYPVAQNFYDELIAGRPYEEHYITVKEAIEEKNNGTSNLTHGDLEALKAVIRRNFVNVDVFLGRLRKLEIIDSPKITRTSLMSQLGGTLNLWAGITLVLVIEFLEYLLRMFVLPKDS